MSNVSVAHSHVQNQPKSSWIDDPFGLKGAFKGLERVNHKLNLSNYAQELVAQFGDYDSEVYSLDLDSLPEEEQNELARLFMEATDRETSECVYGDDFSIESDFTCALLAMLQNDCNKTRERFAEVTRKNVITYYAKSLQETLDEACDNYLYGLRNEDPQDYDDMDSEESTWSRF